MSWRLSISKVSTELSISKVATERVPVIEILSNDLKPKKDFEESKTEFESNDEE